MRKTMYVWAAALFVLSACGDASEHKHGEEGHAPEKKVEQEVKKEVVEVTIEANDQMKFDKQQIEVPANSKVKLTLKNVGEMPKETMGHNWTLLNSGVDLVAYAQASMQAKESDYQSPDMYKDPIVYTKILGPGESETIEFDAPEPGTYKFLCTFPGHYGMMQGDFIVK